MKRITVMRLEVPPNFERVLSSTNLIENLFSGVRGTARRVKRWQGGIMVLRCTAGRRARSRTPLAQNRRLPRAA